MGWAQCLFAFNQPPSRQKNIVFSEVYLIHSLRWSMMESPGLFPWKARRKIVLLLTMSWLWSEKSVIPWLLQRKILEKCGPTQPAFPPRKWTHTVNEDDCVGLPLICLFGVVFACFGLVFVLFFLPALANEKCNHNLDQGWKSAA